MLKDLNNEQREAVMETDKPVLVIAGAGSGKTKVLTTKIAYLIQEKGLAPWNILAITFTNKAASEMKERVEKIVPVNAKDVWVGTFHSICVKILRRHIPKIGYTSDFTIYDTQEQKTLIKQILQVLDIDSKSYNEKYFQNKISNAKNRMLTPENYLIHESGYNAEMIQKVFNVYQKRLKENNAIDFDDIINLTIDILETDKEVLNYYADKFKYVLVDEYQDTNMAQFNLIKLFTSKHKQITVVGDNDQGIYSFRGANIRNILEFEQDFKDARVIKLEQNYRSTQKILEVANAVISNNPTKYDKKLWTNQKEGEKVHVVGVKNHFSEARFVTEKIEELINEYGYKFSDFAILYRMNTLSRTVEESLLRAQMPYKIIGGFKFYERKEIRDVIAYLRLIQNPFDNVAFSRVINEPKRGIGATSIVKMNDISINNGISMLDIIKNADEYGLGRIKLKAQKFVELIERLSVNKDRMSLTEIYNDVLENSGYIKELESLKNKDPQAENRLENINELYNVISEFEESNEEIEQPTLEEFLEQLSLSSDSDELESQNQISLMTIHTSKGLEYPVVFLIGLEEGIFPSEKSKQEDGLEEERRLCYVGITRAKKHLYITHAKERTSFGKTVTQTESCFLNEIPDELVVKNYDNYIGSFDYYNNYNKYNPREEKKNKGISFIGMGSPNIGNEDYTYNMGYSKEKTNTEEKHQYIDAKEFLNNLMNNYNQNTSNNESKQKFNVGENIVHKKLGKGKIINIIEESKTDNEMRRILVIDFKEQGIKKLLESVAPITKIE
ncbi:MAG: ATP-dependent helicase [Clostridium sp.]